MTNVGMVRFGLGSLMVYPGSVPYEQGKAVDKEYKTGLEPYLPALKDNVEIGIYPHSSSRRTGIIKLAQQGDADLFDFFRLEKGPLIAFLSTPSDALTTLQKKVRYNELMSMVKRPSTLITAMSKMDNTRLAAYFDKPEGRTAIHEALVRGDYLKHITLNQFSTMMERLEVDHLTYNQDHAYVMRKDFPPPRKYKKHEIKTVGNTDILPPVPHDHVPDPEWQVHEITQEVDESRRAFMGRVLKRAISVFATPGGHLRLYQGGDGNFALPDEVPPNVPTSNRLVAVG